MSQVATAAAAIHRTAASRGTSSPTMTSSTLTPAEPSQNTVVTSQLIGGGGGCTARTMLSSAAELARMSGMDTATTTIAKPSRNASDARRRVVPPPRGPSTAARSRPASRWCAAGTPSLVTAVIGFLQRSSRPDAQPAWIRRAMSPPG
jgi:hypothetical protein